MWTTVEFNLCYHKSCNKLSENAWHAFGFQVETNATCFNEKPFPEPVPAKIKALCSGRDLLRLEPGDCEENSGEQLQLTYMILMTGYGMTGEELINGGQEHSLGLMFVNSLYISSHGQTV